MDQIPQVFFREAKLLETHLFKIKDSKLVRYPTVMDTSGIIWEEKPPHWLTPSRDVLINARPNIAYFPIDASTVD